MRQAIALAVLQATTVSSMVAWGERIILQRNEGFLLKSFFHGIWSLGLLLLVQSRVSFAKHFQLSSIRVLWAQLLQPRENLKLLLFQRYCMKSISSCLWWNYWETWNVWIFIYMRLISLNLTLIFITDTFFVLLTRATQTHSQKSTLLSRFAKQISFFFYNFAPINGPLVVTNHMFESTSPFVNYCFFMYMFISTCQN